MYNNFHLFHKEIKMSFLKVTTKLLLALCVGFICHTSLASEDPNMSAEDRAKVVKLLKDSHKQTLDLMEGLSEEQLKFKPAPEKWSVLEVAEHIYLAEGLLFGSVEKALAEKQNPEWETKTKGKTEFLERVMVSRARKHRPLGQAQARRGDREVERVSRQELEIRRRDQTAAEGPHAGSPVPGFQHAQRLPVVDLYTASQHSPQQTDRRGEIGPEFPEGGLTEIRRLGRHLIVFEK